MSNDAKGIVPCMSVLLSKGKLCSRFIGVNWSQTKSSWASASLGLRELRRRCPRASDESSLPGDKLSPPRGELYPPGGEGCLLRVAGISCKAPLLGLQISGSVCMFSSLERKVGWEVPGNDVQESCRN